MLFQNNTGLNDISFLTSMVEFILESPLSEVSGKTFEGDKGYILSCKNKGAKKV